VLKEQLCEVAYAFACILGDADNYGRQRLRSLRQTKMAVLRMHGGKIFSDFAKFVFRQKSACISRRSRVSHICETYEFHARHSRVRRFEIDRQYLRLSPQEFLNGNDMSPGSVYCIYSSTHGCRMQVKSTFR
jgi:hypothetical protein